MAPAAKGDHAAQLAATAKALNEGGYFIHTLGSDKKPAHENGFMANLDSIRKTHEISLGRATTGKTTGIAILAGSSVLYGDGEDTFILTALELEGRAVRNSSFMADFQIAIDRAGLTQLMSTLDAGWSEETPSGGLRWFFRVEAPDAAYAKELSGVSGSLAASHNGEVFAELLVTNKSIIIAPTYGKVHKTGNPYVLRNGGAATAPTLSFREVNALSEVLRDVGDRPEAGSTDATPRDLLDGRSRAMLAQYDKTVSDEQLAALIVEHGWVRQGTDSDGTIRLAKTHDSDSGAVAVGGPRHTGCAWTFSAVSAAPLPAEKHLRPSDVLAMLKYSGDYDTMLLDLQEAGTVKHVPWPLATRRPVEVDVEGNTSLNLGRKIGEALRDAQHPTTKDLPFALALVEPISGQMIAPVSLDTEQALIRWEPPQYESLLLAVVQPVKYTKQGKKFQHSLPDSITASVLPKDRVPSSLAAVRYAATEPIILPNGQTVSTPGYHRSKSALIAIPQRERAFWKAYQVPANPSITDVQLAAQYIFNEVLPDFPFETEGDRARAMAYMLTAVSRPLYGACPGILIDASERGSGKTLLATITRVVASGSAAHTTVGYSKSADVETEKAIVAAALEGGVHLHCDELPRGEKVDSKVLMEVITAEKGGVRKRVLGRSGTTVIPPMLITICGNNAALGGDSNRRFIPIRMVNRTAGLAFERTAFRHDDIMSWVRANRPQLLAALHTILSYGLKNPPGLESLPKGYGSFEGWMSTVGGAMHYVQMGDRTAAEVFSDGRRDFVEEHDDEGEEWAPIMEAWVKHFGEGFTTAKEAHGRFAKAGRNAVDLPAVLLPVAGVTEASQAKIWGRALSSRKETSVVSEGRILRFEVIKDIKRGNRFRVTSVADVHNTNASENTQAEVPAVSPAPASQVRPVVRVATEAPASDFSEWVQEDDDTWDLDAA